MKGIILSGAKFTKLHDVLEACHEIPNAATVSGEANQSMTDKSEGDEYMGFKPETILNLQRQWRRVFSRVHEHRRLQETPHGQIFLPVQRLCSTIFNSGHGIKYFLQLKRFTSEHFCLPMESESLTSTMLPRVFRHSEQRETQLFRNYSQPPNSRSWAISYPRSDTLDLSLSI